MRSLMLVSLCLLAAAPALAQPPPPAAVEVSKAELRSVAPMVTATGVVQSRSGANMAAAVNGQLDFVAEAGTPVKQGDVIARVDVSELRLQRTEESVRVTRSGVALKQAERELERLRASGNAVSRFQLDQAEASRDLARSDLEIARATLRQTDERLSRADLRAPFPGVVSERLKRAGEEVARGETVVRLHDTARLEIRVFLPLRHVRAIGAGSEVNVDVDGQVVPARVRSVVPVGDARSQSFEALIETPADAALTVGRTVRVALPLEAAKETVAVPRDALVIRADGLAVFKVKEGKTVERVSVTSGTAAGDWVEVDGAVAPDDSVVVRGAESLRSGDLVKVIAVRSFR